MIFIFDRPNAKTRTIITDGARVELCMLLILTNLKEIFGLFLLCLCIKVVCECEGKVAVESLGAALKASVR